MEVEERARLIQRYRDGHRVVVDALKGITDEELDRSASGEWTPRHDRPPPRRQRDDVGDRLRRLSDRGRAR